MSIKTNKIKVYNKDKSEESDGGHGGDSERKAHYFVILSNERRGFQSTYEISANGIDLRSPRGLRAGEKIIIKFYTRADFIFINIIYKVGTVYT